MQALIYMSNIQIYIKLLFNTIKFNCYNILINLAV